ncbi:hypothetical protein [Streptomyces avidinii]
MTATITALTATGLRAHRDELASLLLAVVDGGSSLGFLAGLDQRDAAAWWDSLLPAVEDGSLALWVSRTGGDGRIDGTQLVPARPRRTAATAPAAQADGPPVGPRPRHRRPAARPRRPRPPAWSASARAAAAPSGLPLRRCGRP